MFGSPILDVILRVMLAQAPAHPAVPAKPAIVTTIPLVGAPTTPAPAALTADAILTNVQKFYADINHVTASFRQSVSNATFGTSKTSDGTVWIMKPGKMRWDYLEKKQKDTKLKKSFISNGKDLYLVEYENLQIITKNLQQDVTPVAISFLYGKGDLRTEFNAQLDSSGKYGDKGDHVLLLTPKKPSAQYKNLILVINPSDFRVSQSVIIDSSNNTNHFRFFSLDSKKAVDAKWFEFDLKSPAVKNFRVVNANQQQPPANGQPPKP